MTETSPLESIFFAALAKPFAERAAYLDQACAGNPDLRRQIEAMVKAHAEAGSFLESPAAGLDVTEHQSHESYSMGAQIGPYKLLQQIGEGGMGTVYMADQAEPVQRKVALKIIKPGMDTRHVIARFEAERQALALMDHPNIAKMLDAGATDTGRPYFVMELVKGIPIIQYCDDHRLTPRKRLELFITVCQAVQHAHQKGIIHRDLKPTNVLVADFDDQPVVKVIDFGVAKAIGQHLTEKTMFTEFGQVLGTIEYMSPEQAKLNQLDIDTRTDIYSLGVLLYELLTGETPFDKSRLRAAAFDEMLRIIREEEPPKPSTRLSTSQSLASTSANRQLEPKKLTTMVRGDLDWIVMKCLDKDRNRRYETASNLGQDLQRYLTNEPVQACPPSTGYKMRKFAQRYRAAIATAATILCILVLGVVISTWQAIRALHAAQAAEAARFAETEQRAEAERQRQQAEANEKTAQSEATKSRQVAQFLKQVFEANTPTRAVGHDTTLLRNILDNAAVRVGRDLNDQPEVEAELRNVIGHTYWWINEFPKSEAMHRRALELYQARFGGSHPLIADTLAQMALALRDQRKDAQAEAALREALAIQRQLLGNETSEVAWSLRQLGLVLMLAKKNPDEAESVEREALAIRRKLSGKNYEVADSLVQMTQVLSSDHDAEAEADAREAVAILKSLKDRGTLLPRALYKLAVILQHDDRLSEAEEAARESVRLMQKAVGNNNTGGVSLLYRLMVILSHEHKDAELDALFAEYPIPTVGKAENRAALLLCRGLRRLDHAEQLPDAESDCRQALALRVGSRGRTHPSTIEALTLLIKALEAQNKSADPEQLLHQAEETANADKTKQETPLPED